jgi:phytoene synthase
MNFADLQLSTPSIAIPRGLFDDHSERDVKRWPINAQQRVLEIFPALQDAAIQFQIPPGYLLDIVDGVLTRQHKTRFETYEQLEHYSAIAVSSVALACIHIWGFKQPLPTAAALDCGMAFQLTNILRDVSADARRGRIYLPRQHYQQHGLSEDDLLKPRGDDRLVCLIQAEAELAKQLFASGWQVWDSIDEDGRPMFSMMWRSYRRLLERIIENPKAVTERRVRLRRREKIRLRAQHFIGPWFRQLPVPPPLSS